MHKRGLLREWNESPSPQMFLYLEFWINKFQLGFEFWARDVFRGLIVMDKLLLDSLSELVKSGMAEYTAVRFRRTVCVSVMMGWRSRTWSGLSTSCHREGRLGVLADGTSWVKSLNWVGLTIGLWNMKLVKQNRHWAKIAHFKSYCHSLLSTLVWAQIMVAYTRHIIL